MVESLSKDTGEEEEDLAASPPDNALGQRSKFRCSTPGLDVMPRRSAAVPSPVRAALPHKDSYVMVLFMWVNMAASARAPSSPISTSSS